MGDPTPEGQQPPADEQSAQPDPQVDPQPSDDQAADDSGIKPDNIGHG